MELVIEFMETVILETIGPDWRIIHKSILMGTEDDVAKLKVLAVAAKASKQPVGKNEIDLAIAILKSTHPGILHFIPDGYIGRFFMALSQVFEVRASCYRGLVTMEKNSEIDGWIEFHRYRTGSPFFMCEFSIRGDFITTRGKSYKNHEEFLFRRYKL